MPSLKSDTRSLEHGTIIECDMFSAIVVTDEQLLVFSSEFSTLVHEGSVLKLTSCGSNAWTLEIHRYDEILIKRDWNDVVTVGWIDHLSDGYYEDDYSDWALNLERYDSWDDYRSLDSPARNLRSDRARNKRCCRR